MDCPRCGAPLRKREPNGKWLPSFECGECWLSFEAVVERNLEHRGHAKGRLSFRHSITLQPGRTLRPAGWMR